MPIVHLGNGCRGRFPPQELKRGRCPACHRQHTRERNAQPHRRAHRTAWHRTLRAYVLNRDGYRCVDCGGTYDLTLDYIVPLQHGGQQNESNALTRCRSCNARKGGVSDVR